MNTKTIIIIAIVIVLLSQFCISDNIPLYVEPINTSVWTPTLIIIPMPEPTHPPTTIPELTPIELIIQDHIDKKEYQINTKLGSDVYVCSHYACDMCESLQNDGYDSGIVIDHTANHAVVWIILDDVRYVIEPQNGDWWFAEEYKMNHNIDFVSISKGREFAKSATEGLHS